LTFDGATTTEEICNNNIPYMIIVIKLISSKSKPSTKSNAAFTVLNDVDL